MRGMRAFTSVSVKKPELLNSSILNMIRPYPSDLTSVTSIIL